MNSADYAVLVLSLVGIAAYGMWRTRGARDLGGYLKGAGRGPLARHRALGHGDPGERDHLPVDAGPGLRDGLGFVQNYFGAPFALILVSAFFLPIYRRLKVYTAYEFLGRSFDSKTRLLGAALFLLQRGLGAGITIYAPAIVLSTVLGWPLDATIVAAGSW